MKVNVTAKSDVIRFGTDGWRAVISDGFTFANVERVSQAYADYINNDRHQIGDDDGDRDLQEFPDPHLIIIGYDRRFLSEQYARRAAEIMAGNNINFVLFDEDVPTPLVSWAVREKSAAGGIVITASHNPAEFNGFKIKAPWGGSASREITAAVESFIDLNPAISKDVSVRDDSPITESVFESYRQQISSYIDLDRIRSTKTGVIIDPMHGAGGQWVESFLNGGSIECETIRSSRDPLFGGVNPEPIDRNLESLKKRVVNTGSVVGLATDGDADRLGAVDESGQTMTMHQVVPILLLHLIRERKMAGDVVTTFTQSVLTKRIAKAHGLELYETAIGFKYIADLMLAKDILIGAEESGGIGVKDHIPERDGVLNSLLLLEAIIAAGRSPSQMVQDIHREFGEFYFDRRDTKMEVHRGQDFVEGLSLSPPGIVGTHNVTDVATIDGTKLIFSDESWLLFRQSGTEPILRVYAEATSRAMVESLVETGISIVNERI